MTDSIECLPGRESEVIALLLEEYRTLRAELSTMLSRETSLLAYSAAGIGLILGFSGSLGRAVAALAPFVILGGGYYVNHAWGVAQIVIHLERLEWRINDLAAKAYGMQRGALTWEGRKERGWKSVNPIMRLLLRTAAARG